MTIAERLLDRLISLALEGQVCPTNPALAADLETCDRVVNHALRQLIERGEISKRRVPTTNRRVITITAGPFEGLATAERAGQKPKWDKQYTPLSGNCFGAHNLRIKPGTRMPSAPMKYTAGGVASGWAVR